MRSALGRLQFTSITKIFVLTVGVVFIFGSMTAQALTAEQARDLPAQELTKQVLGEAGKLFVEVRRPGWQDGAWIFANPEIKGKAPPLRWLTFYGRPSALISLAGVEGLCFAEELRVDFSKNGDVAGLTQDEVGGLSPSVTFGGAPPNAAHQKELNQRCANLSAQHFFSLAGAHGDIGTAIDAVNQVHEAMVHGGEPWLTITCNNMLPNCDASNYAGQTTINDIVGLSSCSPTEKTDDRSHPNDRCWSIGLGGMRCMTVKELTIVLNGDSDRVEIRSAKFREDRIVC